MARCRRSVGGVRCGPCLLCRFGGGGVLGGQAHGHDYFITWSTNFTAVRLSVTISQSLGCLLTTGEHIIIAGHLWGDTVGGQGSSLVCCVALGGGVSLGG